MGIGPNEQFMHRANPDGKFDSICKECFVTVAAGRREVDLEDAEQSHVCNPWERERREQLPQPKPG